MENLNSLYDEEGNLLSVQSLMERLRQSHAGIAPIGLAHQLLDQHAKELENENRVNLILEDILNKIECN